MEITRIKKGKSHIFSDVKKWGGKGDNLLKLSEVFDVPSGFVISSDTYRQFVEDNDIIPFISGVNMGNTQSAYEEIRRKFSQSKMSPANIATLKNEFSRLRGPLAVRSSSVNEDGSNNSFAGQHESILGVTSFDEFLFAIKDVYASLFTPRAIEYRQSQGLENDDSIAIVAQRMINPSSSGVVYSPSPSNLEEILIESTWGLCTSVVDGRSCDIYRVLDTVTGRTISDISPKKIEMDVFDERTRRVVTKKVPFFKRGKSSLTKDQILEVAKYAKNIEKAYGCPMDMEFVYDSDSGVLYALQARPITGINLNETNIVLPDVPVSRILARSKNTRNQGIFEGPAVVVRGVDHVNKRFDIDGDLREMNSKYTKDGYVLLAPEVPPQLEQHVTNAKAMYATECGTTGHAAAIACEKGIVYLGRGISNVPNLLSSVRSGTRVGIAVSKNEGILYLAN